jgi:hypothetical protein
LILDEEESKDHKSKSYHKPHRKANFQEETLEHLSPNKTSDLFPVARA